MYPWNDRRIEWYQRAVAYNRFDVALAGAIEAYLPKTETVCDLGCGTGYLAMELARRGYRVTAFDKSGLTMEYLRREKERSGLDKLLIMEGDWFHLDFTRLWDNVVMVFAGHLDVDMELFFSFVRQRLILVIKDDDQSHVQANGITPLKHVTTPQVKKILSGKNFKCFPMTAQFGQPLKSQEEARDYLNTFGADTESEESALHRLTGTGIAEYPYFLPNEKHMQVFVIWKRA